MTGFKGVTCLLGALSDSCDLVRPCLAFFDLLESALTLGFLDGFIPSKREILNHNLREETAVFCVIVCDMVYLYCFPRISIALGTI